MAIVRGLSWFRVRWIGRVRPGAVPLVVSCGGSGYRDAGGIMPNAFLGYKPKAEEKQA
jgi:hypothetical protein